MFGKNKPIKTEAGRSLYKKLINGELDFSEVEDHPNGGEVLSAIARSAAVQATTESFLLGVPVTTMEGNQFIENHPDGTRTVVGHTNNPKLKWGDRPRTLQVIKK